MSMSFINGEHFRITGATKQEWNNIWTSTTCWLTSASQSGLYYGCTPVYNSCSVTLDWRQLNTVMWNNFCFVSDVRPIPSRTPKSGSLPLPTNQVKQWTWSTFIYIEKIVIRTWEKKNLTLNAIHQGLIVWEIKFVQITERFFAFFQTIYANNNTQLLQEWRKI